MAHGRQSSDDGSRLKKDARALEEKVDKHKDEQFPIGLTVLFTGDAVPGSHWLVCNGQKVLRSTYPRLAKVIGGAAVTDAEIELPAMAPPAGFLFYLWGPPG